MKAVRITAKLADKLSDLARRMQAIRRAEKLAKELKRFGGWGKNSYKKGKARYEGKYENDQRNPIDGGNEQDKNEALTYKVVNKVVNKGVVTPVLGADPVGVATDGYAKFAPSDLPGTEPKEPTAYDQRPPSQSFDQRMDAGMTNQQKIKEDFG